MKKGELVGSPLGSCVGWRVGLSANFGAAGELGTFFHGEDFGFDVTVDLGFVF